MINQIKDLCKLMHEETIFRNLSYDGDKLQSYINQMLKNEDGVVFRRYQDNKLIGIMVGEVYQHIFTDDLIAVDQLLYVHPEYRRLGHAAELVESYKKWAKGKGAKLIMIGSSTGFKGAEEFFKSLGFSKLGGNYGLW